MSGFWYRQILYTACCIRFILDRGSFYAEIQNIFRDSALKIVILSSIDSEAESNPLLTGKFLSWILMKIGECVRLGVRRKVIKGFFERKKFLGSYLSFKICQIFFRICTLHYFLFINKFEIFLNFVLFTLALVLLKSYSLEFLKYLYSLSVFELCQKQIFQQLLFLT